MSDINLQVFSRTPLEIPAPILLYRTKLKNSNTLKVIELLHPEYRLNIISFVTLLIVGVRSQDTFISC